LRTFENPEALSLDSEPGALSVSGRALIPVVQIDRPEINESADCLPVPVRRARRLNGRSAERFFYFKILDISTPTMGTQSQIIISRAVVSGRPDFRALPETAYTLIP